MTTTEPAELKPCPLCKRQPEHKFFPEEDFGEWDTHQFVCQQDNDHLVVAIDTTKEGAAAKWNTRVSTQPAPVADDAVEAVRKASQEARELAFNDVPVSEWGKYIAGKTIEIMQKQGYHLTRPTMTDAELEREMRDHIYDNEPWERKVKGAILTAKKYRG